ncbi:MAG: tannase/feruloyl esterase family alpha/beta hydrolase, partial [Terracidiphilus sp.]
DKSDGLVDGSIADPRRCDFNVRELICKRGQTENCLSKVQVDALQPYYQPLRNSNGGTEFVSPGETSFAGHPAATGAAMYIHGPGPLPMNFFSGWFQLWNQDPNWDWHMYDTKEVEKVVAEYGPRDAWTLDFDAFRARGGKLILIQGWADWGISPDTTIAFYNKLLTHELGRRANSTPSAFARLFMAPDTDHCVAGDSMGPFSTTPVVGLEFDALSAVAQWRRTGVPPASIAARRAQPLPNGSVRTRPICPFPQEAVYGGAGSIDDAANFACKVKK